MMYYLAASVSPARGLPEGAQCLTNVSARLFAATGLQPPPAEMTPERGGCDIVKTSGRIWPPDRGPPAEKHEVEEKSMK